MLQKERVIAIASLASRRLVGQFPMAVREPLLNAMKVDRESRTVKTVTRGSWSGEVLT